MKSVVSFIKICLLVIWVAGCSDSNETSQEDLFPPNEPPSVVLPVFALATEGETFSLAPEVIDADSSTFTYLWSQISGVSVTVNNPTAEVLSFQAPAVDETQLVVFELTVTDRDGGSGSASVEIVIARDDTGVITGKVVDAISGDPVVDATVRSGEQSRVTDSEGNYIIYDLTFDPRTVVNAYHPDYGDQSRVISVSQTERDVKVTISMTPSVELSFEANDGAVLSISGSSSMVDIPGGALVDANGDEYSGTVNAKVTAIAPSDNVRYLSGDYSVAGPLPIEAFGGLSVELTDPSGNPLQLASDATADVRIELGTSNNSPPGTAAVYVYDDTQGIWTANGNFSYAGSYYEGSVDTLGVLATGFMYDRISITGCVSDLSGNRISGITVKTEGTDYSGTTQTLTDDNGNFSIFAKQSSEVTLYASKNGTLSSTKLVPTGSVDIDIEECLFLEEGVIRIQLTWGSGPSDLDSHLIGPDYHVYYANKGSLSEAPFAQLDVDDVTSFGPEVITITQLENNSEYAYSVYNFSRTFDPGITGSPAVVELNLDGDITVFTPPGGEGDNLTWNVFTLVVDGRGEITVRTDATWSPNAPSL